MHALSLLFPFQWEEWHAVSAACMHATPPPPPTTGLGASGMHWPNAAGPAQAACRHGLLLRLQMPAVEKKKKMMMMKMMMRSSPAGHGQLVVAAVVAAAVVGLPPASCPLGTRRGSGSCRPSPAKGDEKSWYQLLRLTATRQKYACRRMIRRADTTYAPT